MEINQLVEVILNKNSKTVNVQLIIVTAFLILAYFLIEIEFSELKSQVLKSFIPSSIHY